MQAALRHRGDKKNKQQRKNGLSDQMPSSIEQNMNSSKDVRSIGPAQLKAAMTKQGDVMLEGSPLTSNFSDQISPENAAHQHSPPGPI